MTFIWQVALLAKQSSSMAMYLPAVVALPFLPLLSMILTAAAFALTTHNTFKTAPTRKRFFSWRQD